MPCPAASPPPGEQERARGGRGAAEGCVWGGQSPPKHPRKAGGGRGREGPHNRGAAAAWGLRKKPQGDAKKPTSLRLSLTSTNSAPAVPPAPPAAPGADPGGAARRPGFPPRSSAAAGDGARRCGAPARAGRERRWAPGAARPAPLPLPAGPGSAALGAAHVPPPRAGARRREAQRPRAGAARGGAHRGRLTPQPGAEEGGAVLPGRAPAFPIGAGGRDARRGGCLLGREAEAGPGRAAPSRIPPPLL